MIRPALVDCGDAEKIVLDFAGQLFEPLPSGALYWPAEATLLVADLHFEKMASFAARGQLFPPYDTGLTLGRLEQDLRATGAARVIALGDSFHRDESIAGLQPGDRTRLGSLTGLADWVWIAGNHDPNPHQLGGVCRAGISIAGMEFVHEPRRGGGPCVAGHLHPAARVRLNGRSVRRACFAADGRQMILPAYGSSTGNLNILGPAFAGYLRMEDLQVVMLGQDRAYAVNPKRLVRG